MYLSISRRRVGALALTLSCTLLAPGVEGGELARPDVACKACYVIDDAGRVFFAREPHRALANASTTKMVTALLIARAAEPSEEVKVSARAAATGGGGLDLDPGDRYSVEELLYALLLTSSNDAAVALAEHVRGSESRFVGEMNQVARALGAHDSHFLTAHGLDMPGHYSSAHDLARIAEALLDEPALAEIVATREVTIEGSAGSEFLENRNPLVGSYRGAIGVKTGYTVEAGNVLVAAAVRRGRRVIAVAMGSPDAATDARTLLDFGFARLRRSVLVGADAPIAALVFDPAGAVGAVVSDPVRGLANPRSLDIAIELTTAAGPPLAAGEVVGTVRVASGGRVLDAVPAIATRRLPVHQESWLVAALSAVLGAVGRLVHE